MGPNSRVARCEIGVPTRAKAVEHADCSAGPRGLARDTAHRLTVCSRPHRWGPSPHLLNGAGTMVPSSSVHRQLWRLAKSNLPTLPSSYSISPIVPSVPACAAAAPHAPLSHHTRLVARFSGPMVALNVERRLCTSLVAVLFASAGTPRRPDRPTLTASTVVSTSQPTSGH